jgi:transcriptional regulator with XRE-family HTH domain
MSEDSTRLIPLFTERLFDYFILYRYSSGSFLRSQDLRKARRLTQEQMAKSLGIRQDSTSKLEKRTDLLLSTLRGYVEAMGGKLELRAEFPDRPAVILTGLADLDE